MAAVFALAAPIVAPFITEGWGHQRNRGLHGGLDFRARTPMPVFAINDGVVLFSAPYSDGSGDAIEIDHLNGTASRYLHLSTRSVAKGQMVKRGQQIGMSGYPPRSPSLPHLHFDFWATPGIVAQYVAKFGQFVGSAGTRSFAGKNMVKTPAEPLIPGTGYQADVLSMMQQYNVKQSTGVFGAATSPVVLVTLIGAASFLAWKWYDGLDDGVG